MSGKRFASAALSEPRQPILTQRRKGEARAWSLSFLATLISGSKVIHRRRGEHLIYSPQPPVNNFGGAQKMCCEKLPVLLNRQVEHAGAGRRILRPNVATFSQRLSLRHPAPGRKGTLRTFRLQVQTWQRRTSISLSIRRGRVLNHKPSTLNLVHDEKYQ
jgi:hypothetical protein